MNPLDIPDDYPKDKVPEDGDVLWDHVTRDVTPIRKSGHTVPVRTLSSHKRAAVTEDRVVPPVAVAPMKPGGHEVDGNTGRKLKRGDYPIDLTLDLHGLTQVAAHKKLRETVTRAHSRNLRCILVITGKGRGQDGGMGVLKKRVPLWLQEPDLRPVILRVEPAQPLHGGSGALYVLLRRTRTNKDQ